jgi:hypothetical protein
VPPVAFVSPIEVFVIPNSTAFCRENIVLILSASANPLGKTVLSKTKAVIKSFEGNTPPIPPF